MSAEDSFVHIEEQDIQSDDNEGYNIKSFQSTSLQLKHDKSIEENNDSNESELVKQDEPHYESLGIQGFDTESSNQSTSSLGLPSFIGSRLLNFKPFTRFSSVSSASEFFLK